MDGKDPVCYYIGDISDFTTLDPKRMEWYQFLPDKCVNKASQPFQVGQFSMKLTIHDVTRNDPIEFEKDKKRCSGWCKSVPKRSNPIKIRAYIYQCRDLPPADDNGVSDPYVEVWDTTATKDRKKRTMIVEDNLNPLFYKTVDLAYEVDDADDLLSYPPFIFDVFDFDDDILDHTPDFLCRAVVEPEDCAIKMIDNNDKFDSKKCYLSYQETKEYYEKEKIPFVDKDGKPYPDNRGLQEGTVDGKNPNPKYKEVPIKPRWHPCHFSSGSPQCGEILVSFTKCSDEYNHSQAADEVRLNDLVEEREFKVNMLILGLRNLQSAGILPVKKAFIKFNVKSLVPPDGPAVKNIQTIPTAPGPNPTMNSTMQF